MTPCAGGMRRVRNSIQNDIRFSMAMIHSTCCPGSVTCFATLGPEGIVPEGIVMVGRGPVTYAAAEQGDYE
ncbi:MAG TPA: hypothetical protein VGL95_02145 [Acetobacteraceae bacterium]